MPDQPTKSSGQRPRASSRGITLGGAKGEGSPAGHAKSLAGHSRNRSLSGGQPCPYLGSLDREHPYGHPSQHNICRGQTSTKRRGFRKITVGFVKLDRKLQKELCLAEFSGCAHFQKKLKEPPAPVKTQIAPAHKKRHPRRHYSRSNDRFKTTKWDTAKQLGAISAVAILIAFVASFVLGGGPGKFIEAITFSYIQSQAKDLGLSKRDLDKIKASGVLSGGGAPSMKGLSASQKTKLKKKFGGLSASQKAKLKKKFGGMFGK